MGDNIILVTFSSFSSTLANELCWGSDEEYGEEGDEVINGDKRLTNSLSSTDDDGDVDPRKLSR
jgi:hypothetical protein